MHNILIENGEQCSKPWLQSAVWLLCNIDGKCEHQHCTGESSDGVSNAHCSVYSGLGPFPHIISAFKHVVCLGSFIFCLC